MVTRQEVYNKGHREGAVKGGFRGCLGGLLLTTAAALPFFYHQFSANRYLETELESARTTISRRDSDYNSANAEKKSALAKVAGLETGLAEAAVVKSENSYLKGEIAQKAEKLKTIREEQGRILSEVRGNLAIEKNLNEGLRREVDGLKEGIVDLNAGNEVRVNYLLSENEQLQRRADDIAGILSTLYIQRLLLKDSDAIGSAFSDRMESAQLAKEISFNSLKAERADGDYDPESDKKNHEASSFFYTNSRYDTGEVRLFFTVPDEAERVEVRLAGKYMGYFEIEPRSSESSGSRTAFIPFKLADKKYLDTTRVNFMFFKRGTKRKEEKRRQGKGGQ